MEAPEYLDLDEIDFSDDAVVSYTHRPGLQVRRSACPPPSADGINSSLNITALHSCPTAVCNYYLTNVALLFFPSFVLSGPAVFRDVPEKHPRVVEEKRWPGRGETR